MKRTYKGVELRNGYCVERYTKTFYNQHIKKEFLNSVKYYSWRKTETSFETRSELNYYINNI